MLKYIVNIYSLNTSLQTKRGFYWLVLLIIINTLLETFSIALLLPFINIIITDQLSINFEKFYNSYNTYFAQLYTFDLFHKEKIYLILIILLIIFFTLRFIFSLFFLHQNNLFVSSIEKKISSRVFVNYLSQNYEFFLKKNSSIFMKNIVNNCSQMGSSIYSLIILISEIFILTSLTLIIFISNLILSLISVSFLLILIITFYFFTNKNIKKYSYENNKLLSQRGILLKDTFLGIKEIIIFNSKNFFLNSFNNLNYKLINNIRKTSFLQSLFRPTIEYFVILIIFLFVIYNLFNSEYYAQTLSSVIFVVLIIIRLLPSLSKILFHFHNIRSKMGGGQVVLSSLKLKDNLRLFQNYKKFHKKIEFKNLNFSYNDNKKFNIKNVNFDICKGDYLFLKGISGSGKSTLLDIMCGLLKPLSGKIILDKKDITNDNLSNIFRYVSQNTYLIDGSIKSNICFAGQKFHLKKFKKCLRICELDQFINSLFNKEEELLGENGLAVSGGQKQRIAIARALYSLKDNILVLDEATNALDETTENKIFLNIKNNYPNMTLIVASHNQYLQKIFNKVLEFKNNRIVLNKI